MPAATFAQALNSALAYKLASDPDVLVFGEEVGDPAGGPYKVTRGLPSRYGRERVRSTPISEQAIVGAAIGAAIGGMRPIAEIMLMDYLPIAMDQLVNHAAKFRYMTGGRLSVPMTVRAAVGGGIQGAAQHSQSLESWFMHVPGLKVVMPSGPRDAYDLLIACIEDDDPCLFLECLELLWDTAREELPSAPSPGVPLGVAGVIRPGSDVTLISYGRMIRRCTDAARTLAREAIEAEVIDLRSLVPLDMATVITSVARTRRAVVVHAAPVFAGAGAEIAAQLSAELFDDLAAPVARVGAENAPTPFSVHLESRSYPDVDAVCAAARATLGVGPLAPAS